MSDVTPDSGGQPDEPEGEGSYSFFQMFFVPMVIAAVLTGVIIFFGLIGSDSKAVNEYLQEIQFGSQHQRWQSAYELAYHLQRDGAEGEVTAADRKVALEIFERELSDQAHPAGDTGEVTIREYMALTLGLMKASEAVPALLEALDHPSDRTRIHAIVSLGNIGDPRAEEPLVARLGDSDAGIRKAAAFALGGIGGVRALEGLRASLADSVADVRWNGALSLARLGDASGKDVLLTMVDRAAVTRTEGITESQINDVLEGAARALGALHVKESVPLLSQLASSDPDHRVRTAAYDSLEELGEPAS